MQDNKTNNPNGLYLWIAPTLAIVTGIFLLLAAQFLMALASGFEGGFVAFISFIATVFYVGVTLVVTFLGTEMIKSIFKLDEARS